MLERKRVVHVDLSGILYAHVDECERCIRDKRVAGIYKHRPQLAAVVSTAEPPLSVISPENSMVGLTPPLPLAVMVVCVAPV